MKQLVEAILLATLLVLTSGVDRAAPSIDTAPADSHIRFIPVQVYIDPHGKPLACYQVRIIATAGDAKLVGIEGGESSAFNNAPYYDPRALQGNRIILGAYSLAADLPARNTRVATLMFRVAGAVQPTFEATLDVAGTTDGSPIAANVAPIPIVPPARANGDNSNHGEAR